MLQSDNTDWQKNWNHNFRWHSNKINEGAELICLRRAEYSARITFLLAYFQFLVLFHSLWLGRARCFRDLAICCWFHALKLFLTLYSRALHFSVYCLPLSTAPCCTHFPLTADTWKGTFISFINSASFCQTFALAICQYIGTLCDKASRGKENHISCPTALGLGMTWLGYPSPGGIQAAAEMYVCCIHGALSFYHKAHLSRHCFSARGISLGTALH